MPTSTRRVEPPKKRTPRNFEIKLHVAVRALVRDNAQQRVQRLRPAASGWETWDVIGMKSLYPNGGVGK